MILVIVPLTKRNFLEWRVAMTMALGAKQKLGFVNGALTQLDESDDSYEY